MELFGRPGKVQLLSNFNLVFNLFWFFYKKEKSVIIMYNPGGPNSHFQGSPADQSAFAAREEVADVLVGDDETHFMDGIHPGMPNTLYGMSDAPPNGHLFHVAQYENQGAVINHSDIDDLAYYQTHNGGDIGGTSNNNDDRNIGTTSSAGGIENNRRAAARLRGSTDATCLHLICKLPNPPLDVVKAIVEAAPDVVSWTDAHGWLPLHHACANGANPNVMKVLIDAFPSGSIQQDKQLRTPLHFYATRVHAPEIPPAIMARNAELLTRPYKSVTAAQLPDRNGMLPMHHDVH